MLEKGADVTVGNVYEPFLGACHRFDIFADRLLDGYTVAEASWMSMPVLSWQGVVFGDPLYRPYARMKDMDVKPTEEDRYFQGWWASSVQFGDRWRDRSAGVPAGGPRPGRGQGLPAADGQRPRPHVFLRLSPGAGGVACKDSSAAPA